LIVINGSKIWFHSFPLGRYKKPIFPIALNELFYEIALSLLKVFELQNPYYYIFGGGKPYFTITRS